MAAVLPKKRGAPQQGRGAPLHDLSNRGRVISGRSALGPKRKVSVRHVSRGDMFVGREDDDANASFGEDAIHFHENRNTIMSNFEEWIKLSTDNKITSKNSWQFALIDYFHDLNVIKDGDNINFQRASATLDGCVKIYLSRVESVASETGKLLSGLATKKGQLELEQEDDDNDDADDPTQATRKERRVNRVVESTLVPFDTLRVKKLDQELAIDPLFKKALADFDEGGAKSLLLNTLNIDSSGRVVFDATTNSIKEDVEEELQDRMDEDERPINLSKLHNMLFTESADLEMLSICPSIKELKVVLNDVNQAKSVLGNVNSKFMSEEDEERNRALVAPEEPPVVPDFDYDMDFDEDAGADIGFANIEEDIQAAEAEPQTHQYDEVVATGTVMDQDLMAYFDENMRTNWRGPEHWRVTALKQAKNLDQRQSTRPAANPDAPKRKRKENITVDFFEEDTDDYLEDIFQKPKNQFQISKKPEERRSEDLHILPDDIQFSSQRLVNLFIKPAKTIMTFSRRVRPIGVDDDDVEETHRTYTDEQYFAGKYMEQEKAREEEERQEKLAASFHQAEMDDYDNDNFGGIDFNDVLGGTDGPLEDAEDKKEDLGSQFVTGGRRARPEYVNFSKVAKRVDIKLLKDNLWKSIKSEAAEGAAEVAPSETAKNFTEVVEVIGGMYRPEEKKDLSTSFCFICLLHLANEHGLSLESSEQYDDLHIKGF